MTAQAEMNAMRVRVRRRARATRQAQSDGTDHNALLQELQRNLLASPDFRQMFDQLEQKLLRQLAQQLVTQPLQQVGSELGGGIRDAIFGGGDDFAPSASQAGALLSRLLDSAEGIL